MALTAKLDENRFITALKNSFFGIMPLLIVGSFFLILSNIPITGYSDFMASILGENWSNYFLVPYNMTMNIMTLYFVISMAMCLADGYELDKTACIMASLAAFLVLTPIKDLADGGTGIPTDNLSASGLFLGILCATGAVAIVNFCYKRDIRIKMPEMVPPSVSNAFSALIPVAIVLVVFNIITILFSFTESETVQTFIFSALQKPLIHFGTTFPATMVVILLKGILWALGLHGANIVGAVMNPIWLSNTADNGAAAAAGLPLPHIVTSQFDANFVQIGGSGATIGLVLLMVFFAKSKQFKQVGKLSLGCGIFNINEPVIFGTPLILNPIMAIPFIFTSLILAVIAYAAFAIGLVPYTNGVNIPWTTPPIISGFLVCGWRGALLNIVQIIISVFCYLPFFKIADKQACEKENEREQELLKETAE